MVPLSLSNIGTTFTIVSLGRQVKIFTMLLVVGTIAHTAMDKDSRIDDTVP